MHLKSKELKLAGNLAKNLISFKKKIIKNKNLKKLILYKKKELENFYNINIEYLELRNRKDLKLSNTIKNSKIFIAYYLNEIRLIDNF